MKKIYIIISYSRKTVPQFLLKQLLEERGYTVVLCGTSAFVDKILLRLSQRIRTLFKQVQYLFVSTIVVIRSRPKDPCIFRQDIMGVYTALICKFLGRRRRIIIVNLMINPRNSYLIRLAAFALKGRENSGITATVNSEASRLLYQNLLDPEHKHKFELLYDDYGKREHLISPYKEDTNDRPEVFCGGYNGRDWDFMVELAAMRPEWRFVVVGARKFLKDYKISPNVKYHEDISQDRFVTLLGHSTLVCCPLKTDGPSGLLLLFMASLMQKPIVLSDNPVVREYIPDPFRGKMLFPKGDHEACIQLIDGFLATPQKSTLQEMQRHIVKTCSPTAYVDRLTKLLER